MKRDKNKGITLVALIITIIVLLILAVVAMQAVQGDGIIAHAQNARDRYEQETENENTMLSNLTDYIGNQLGANEENENTEDNNYIEFTVTAENRSKVDVDISEGNEKILTIKNKFEDVDGKKYKVTTIGENAYANTVCGKFIIPDTVKEIKTNAFAQAGIDELVLGKGIVKIEESAIYNSYALFSKVTYNGTKQNWNAINIGKLNNGIISSAKMSGIHCTDGIIDIAKFQIFAETGDEPYIFVAPIGMTWNEFCQSYWNLGTLSSSYYGNGRTCEVRDARIYSTVGLGGLISKNTSNANLVTKDDIIINDYTYMCLDD